MLARDIATHGYLLLPLCQMLSFQSASRGFFCSEQARIFSKIKITKLTVSVHTGVLTLTEEDQEYAAHYCAGRCGGGTMMQSW